MKKSEITEINALRDRSCKDSLPDSFIVTVTGHKVDIRHIKHQVTVFRILPEEVEITLLYPGKVIGSNRFFIFPAALSDVLKQPVRRNMQINIQIRLRQRTVNYIEQLAVKAELILLKCL